MNFRKVNIEVNTLTEKARALDDGYYLKSQIGYTYFKEGNNLMEYFKPEYGCISHLTLTGLIKYNFEVYEKIEWWDDLPRLCKFAVNGTIHLIVQEYDKTQIRTDGGFLVLKKDVTPLTNEEIKQFIKD